ncbi:MAG TPA: glycosyltransferase family 1 protein [Longimicrobiaceae bacterium]|nr:glycosyltransferase family 1 protein [Longimicrobiaceae bacterium]
MRVLFDISMLGLGHLYSLSRAGTFRAHQHLAEGLAASGECELLFCANHSSFVYQGCIEYLRESPRLGHLPLLGPSRAGAPSALRRGVAGAHRWARALLRSNQLPPLLRYGGRLVDRRIHAPVSNAAPPVDVFHSPAVPLPARAASGRSPQRFLTIFDVAYTRVPAAAGRASPRAVREALDSVREGDWVLTSSESTRADLCACGVEPERVFVAPLAADPHLFAPCTDAARLRGVRERYGIPAGPYLLSVNALDPRKNMPHALRAFARLVQQEGVRDLSYVLAGHSGPGSPQVEEALRAFPALRDRIVLTGFVADDDLAPLYSGAAAFVYPSLYEGFGLAPLEAMQCGAPVIVSDVSSLPEVVGDAGILVDPRDGDALCQAMLDVYRDAALRERMREQSLGRAATFSWERCTRQTLDAYRTALAA